MAIAHSGLAQAAIKNRAILGLVRQDIYGFTARSCIFEKFLTTRAVDLRQQDAQTTLRCQPGNAYSNEVSPWSKNLFPHPRLRPPPNP